MVYNLVEDDSKDVSYSSSEHMIRHSKEQPSDWLLRGRNTRPGNPPPCTATPSQSDGFFPRADVKKREVCGYQWVRKSWQGGGKKAN